MELFAICLGITFLPAWATVIGARILIYQWHASPHRLERLVAILGGACLIWIALAGCALWSQSTCLHLPAPCESCLNPCQIRDLRLIYPVLFNAAIVFFYALIHLLWALHYSSHELW